MTMLAPIPMHPLGFVLFGFVALFWLTHGLRVVYGATRLPWLKDFAPAQDSDCPPISILFAARDEEEKLRAALATLMEIDYPSLEVVAVDDRSNDSTGRILDEFAAAHPRLRVVHVSTLPPGWLGKPHALQKAYEICKGDWLLFTDADVRFNSDVLRRAISLVKQRNLDHLSLLCDIEMAGFWEKALITFFAFVFYIASDPHRASYPHSRFYVGIGAFQMVKRSVYEASGTHRRLAMEVIDDMKLGKIIKQSGFRSGVGVGQDMVILRWHAGLGNVVQGVTKNFFAAAGYNLVVVGLGIAGLLLTSVAPFLGLLIGRGWIRVFAAVAVVIAVCFHAAVAVTMRVSPLYALTHPLGTILLSYMLLRSTVVTLWQGGIVWRDTFYPLEELRRGVV
ncbi:MAG TPA: glycosyltransferase family 2 protein [Candidatus Acidoferrum sp.]|nr:glycosyltransferase family 2 protein [Candidatus Acidoferrum sp.]